MNDFSKRIHAGRDFLPEFYFHRVFSVSGNQRYHISVKDDAGHSLFFSMERKNNGKWKIIDAPKVPDWIMELEPVLNDAIVESVAA